ncbi:Membrane proteinase PrsW, cleaves anti-sigma factor RsiW, M82 family [Alkalithermobacter thermoalcaliphilus JW-YL-7 = DSM 7308]|uniref:Protease PrsW n=1 Tax=Alkalithermobacter thermoalcaliphilus JW-YL-7 = DSM 7308 TaxID=1121328 RepID=A0A150FNR2_CLOPD|nr:Protease PrsW [[Clostridium] paradoxum JW-YL-7 = DSM 7308]SHK84897.1 Membrane proteinase PrsW, cleaves anti-sigma factor RsiW, M82 family [[Clostridium] paradoxum JW-YL-7 = DSM 7308]
MDNTLFVIAIAPSIALGLSIYLIDRYDKEPLSLLLKVFFLGALSVVPTVYVQKFIMRFNIFTGVLWAFYTSFLVAGLVEEYLKRLVVLKTAYKSVHFNEKLDGIVYCTFSALGFATIENIMYVVFRYSANPYVGFYRGILSVPAHMLFGITMGYYLSLAKYCTCDYRKCKEYMLKSLLVPIVLHGIFNFILMSRITFLMILFIPYVIYLWITNLKKLNIYTKDSRDRFNRIQRGE